MVRPLRYHTGGILRLCLDIEEYRGAIESHLISLGLRLRDLGSEDMGWTDLYNILHYPGPGSPLVTALTKGWGVQEELLATATELLAGGNWQRGGGKGSKPKRLVRPYGDGKESDSKVYGKDPIPMGEFDTWWEEAE